MSIIFCIKLQEEGKGGRLTTTLSITSVTAFMPWVLDDVMKLKVECPFVCQDMPFCAQFASVGG